MNKAKEFRVSDPSQRLIASALLLTREERIFVANAILASLEDSADDWPAPSRDAWSAEVGRRVDDLDCGRVKAVPSSEAWKMIDGETGISD